MKSGYKVVVASRKQFSQIQVISHKVCVFVFDVKKWKTNVMLVDVISFCNAMSKIITVYIGFA